MSKTFLEPKHNQETQRNSQQRKSDPKAELEYINSPEPDTSWNIADVDPVIAQHVAQRFAKDEQEDKHIQQKSNEEELQRKESTEGGPASKTAMPIDVQTKMENSFGTDFSNVNIHKESHQATNIGALAYTQGNDVHFAPGQFKPESQKGQELIGHELTHVVQQRQGRVRPEKQGKGMNINSNPALEKEADVMGAEAAKGGVANVAGTGSGVQRQSGEIFTVPQGWGLARIANHLGVTIDALKEANQNKLKTWGNVQGFNSGEVIVVPTITQEEEKSPEDQINEALTDYKGGKITMPDFARLLIPFAKNQGNLIFKIFGKLAFAEQDNLAYALAINVSDSELFCYDNDVLEKMSDVLGNIFKTTSWLENFKQKERVDKAINEKKTVSGKLKNLMNNKYLTPENIKVARELIIQLPEEKLRKAYFQRLQSKVSYENQRDSEVKEGDVRVEKSSGGICNLTSLAMALQYLGISNPHPDMQYEDALEKVRQDNNYSARTGEGWVQVAKKMGAEVSFILDRGNTSAKDKKWWKNNVLTKIQEGYGIMMSIKGHIVRLQDVTESGLVVDDPYGRLDLQKRLDNNKKGGYKKYNKSEWGWSSEGTENEGEDNVWAWSAVEKYAMWWIASFKK